MNNSLRLLSVTTCISFSVLISGCGALPATKEPVDLLLHNGTVLTLNEHNTQATAVAVKGDRVHAIGSDELLERYDAEQLVDLSGRTIMPGFIDTHVHIDGTEPWYIDLAGLESIEALTAKVKQMAATLEPGAWITGYGWSEDELGRRPTNADLDTAAPGHPIMLTRAGAHSAVFSSRALQLAGIDPSTPDPDGGTIERNEDGTLNGIIRERHMESVQHLLPQADAADLRASLEIQLRALFKLGITSITQAMGSFDSFNEWKKVYEQNPGSLPRALVQITYVDDSLPYAKDVTSDNDALVRVGPVKIFVDGGFTGPAAFTKEPYRGESEYRGKLNMSEAELNQQIRDAHAKGWQLGIHAIGDAAIELVVGILSTTLTETPRADHRHYLNHFTVMPSAATMDKMAQFDIAITQQPNFAYTLEGRYREYLDGDRLQHNNPMATPMSHGVHVAMSSDILPLGPWVGIYAATTRKGMSGEVYGASEKISRLDALRAYTAKGAYLTRDEDDKGQLLPGMQADFIVLEDNPFEVSDDALLNMQTAATYLGGRLVWQANEGD